MIRITMLLLCGLGICALVYVDTTSAVVDENQGDPELKDPVAEIFSDRGDQEISEGVQFFGDGCHDYIGVIVNPDKVQVRPEELERISKLNDLRVIDFRGQQSLHGNLDFLSNYELLETLNLSQSGIADTDISDIVAVGGIANLLLDESDITDDGVKKLLESLDVQYLHLSGCRQLTSTICEYIARSGSLRAVYISGTGVDQNHVIDLHNRRPGLAIAWAVVNGN